jgi:hypothetical protein
VKKLITLGIIVLGSPLIIVVAIYVAAMCRDDVVIGLGEQYPNGE